MKTRNETLRADVLVLGSGVAGARAALAASDAGLNVVLATKGEFTRSGATPIAVFACNAVYPEITLDDSVESHFDDTVKAGAFLNNQRLVEVYTTDAPERLKEIDSWGARFTRENGRFQQLVQPGHSHARSLHIESRTGAAFSAAFRKEIRRRTNIRILNDTFVTSYLTDSSSGAVIGATAIDLPRTAYLFISAKAIVDSTGGGMNLYALRSSPPDNTGDGYAMAYRVGAELIDMEFVQFYPGLAHPEPHRGNTGVPWLVRVALEGYILNAEGDRYMARYDPERMEWATRDMLARAFFSELRAGRGTPHGGVWFDATHLDPKVIEERLRPYATPPRWLYHGIELLASGLDVRTTKIETAMVAHYFCGGIRINEYGETTVPGLFAAGEATGGIDGGNRLTGNALSEHLVFGARAGLAAAERARKEAGWREPETEQLEKEWSRIDSIRQAKKGRRPHEILSEIQDCAWKTLNAVRDDEGLSVAVETFRSRREQAADHLFLLHGPKANPWELLLGLEVQNLCLVGEMVARSAQMRKETRAGHMRVEFPEPSPEWLKNVVVQQGREGMEATTSPLVLTKRIPREVLHA